MGLIGALSIYRVSEIGKDMNDGEDYRCGTIPPCDLLILPVVTLISIFPRPGILSLKKYIYHSKCAQRLPYRWLMGIENEKSNFGIR